MDPEDLIKRDEPNVNGDVIASDCVFDRPTREAIARSIDAFSYAIERSIIYGHLKPLEYVQMPLDIPPLKYKSEKNQNEKS